MESKHKNALIGALLAVVFVMAVGYAAFAQLLTINGTATISLSWDVHFDPTQTTSTAVACTAGYGGGTTCGTSGTTSNNPYGTIAYSNSSEKPATATLEATLKSPGDEVTFTLKPTNYGSIAAHAQATPVITSSDAEVVIASGGQSATKGNIRWDIVSFSNKSSLTGANGGSVADANQDTIVVKASFIGGSNEAVAANQSAAITITINYQQA